jgi:predicted ATPase/DNA-binding winged helix-turn-helix (wHTH) protein
MVGTDKHADAVNLANTVLCSDVCEFGQFRLLTRQRALLLGDEPMRLGSRALAILVALVERAGTVVSSDELIAEAWPGLVVEEANLRVQMGLLRKVLARGEGERRAIKTVPLAGYCFVLPVTRRVIDASAVVVKHRCEHNLPNSLAVMVGREEVIELLAQSVANRRLVMIIGPGGIGKTTVAHAVARRCLPMFKDGIRLVDFSSVGDARLVASALSSALGVGTLADQPLAGLLAFLRGTHMLILMDTCEHVVDATAELAEALLSQLPELRILGTSREALRATGEWVYRLPPLTLAPINERPGAIEALAYSAVDLFVQAVRARQDRFELHDNDVHTVLEICRQLDGIPLAIEFAASRVAEVGLKEVASRLGDRFSILTRGRRTALPRHQTLKATLRWSYDLLPVGEQTLLRQLSTFRGPFTAEAAAALAFDGRPEDRSCHATWEQLSNLFDKSLVTADVGDDTLLYRLLDTTRC